jgi:hypothetical protein
MPLRKILLREKTNVTTTGSTTFNAPGTYVPPYGKTVVKIGGRGASGNPTTGGNYSSGGNAYYNPYSPGYDVYGPTGVWQGQFIEFYTWGGDYGYSYNEGFGYSPTPPYSYYGNAIGGCSNVNYNYIYTTYGYLYSNSPSGGNYAGTNPTNYNPTVPGNIGSPSNIGGVNFPGGAIGSLAPTVAATSTVVSYESYPTGLSITVPTGGYVTVQNI